MILESRPSVINILTLVQRVISPLSVYTLQMLVGGGEGLEGEDGQDCPVVVLLPQHCLTFRFWVGSIVGPLGNG